MPAVYRTLSTNSGSSSWGVNLASDPANQPVFFNSYVPWKGYAFGRRTMVQSAHWQGITLQRDPSKTYATEYVAGSEFIAKTLVRWIAHDNTIHDLTPADVLWPYLYVPAAFGGGLASGAEWIWDYDVAIAECTQDIPVPPFALIDARTVPVGTRAFTCDSNFKIIELDWRSCYLSFDDFTSRYLFRTTATGSIPGYGIQAFLHDSGSTAFVEIKPPTSPAAGDGILGLVMFSLEENQGLTQGYPNATVIISSEDHAANPAVLYQQSLGNDYPAVQPWQRQNDDEMATETTEQQILLSTTQLVNLAGA